ncbi:MAG TPA: TraB/GumN family protein [Dehalococcoidia bacterium]|nr:TraB/GumN family protein [Dehalococcoidia bacterium]
MSARPRPPLWVAEQRAARVFLFGVRPGAKDRAWLTPTIEHALGESDEFWCETPEVSEIAQSPLLAELGLSSDRQLTDWLGPSRSDRMRRVANGVEVNPENLQSLRPWLAAQVLNNAMLSRAGLDHSLNMDEVLRALAIKQGKVLQTEFSVEGILRAFAGLPDTTELEYFDWILDVIERGTMHLSATYAAWLQGDLSMDEDDLSETIRLYPGFYDTLVLARNRQWIPRMKRMLESSGVTFMALGVGHLVGVEGVPRLADAAGIELTRVQ